MRKLFTFLFRAMIISSAVSAQTISGIIKDQQGKALDKITVSLLRATDSVAVKFGATDKAGYYSFVGASAGSYLVKATSVSHTQMFSPTIVVEGTDITVPQLTMAKAEKTIEGVTVTSKKPMVEVKADKMILNVEGTINATGSDALELLRKSPGVLVDKDDNVSLPEKMV